MNSRTAIDTTAKAAQNVVVGMVATLGWLIDAETCAPLLGTDAKTLRAIMLGEQSPDAVQPVGSPSLIWQSGLLADYAWGGQWTGDDNDLLDTLTEFSVVAELIGHPPHGPNGPLLGDQDCNTLHKLLAATWARYYMDQGSDLDFEGLAALAGVADKTIRMAANPALPNALRTFKEGSRTLIKAADALAWLSQRKDFCVTRAGPAQPAVLEAASLSTACRSWRENTGLSIDELSTELGWSVQQAEAYLSIESGQPRDVIEHFRPGALLALAQRLRMPEPSTFARDAYRVLALAHAETLTAQQLAADL